MTAPLAYAVHSWGYDPYRGRVDTTFVYLDAALKDQLGWVEGHQPEGSEWGGHRLVLTTEDRARSLLGPKARAA